MLKALPNTCGRAVLLSNAVAEFTGLASECNGRFALVPLCTTPNANIGIASQRCAKKSLIPLASVKKGNICLQI